MEREVLSLNGFWDFCIPNGKIEKRKVPSSFFCVGESIYRKKFEIYNKEALRALLYFEGIAYEGYVEVNGAPIGNMLPYSRYIFDITEKIREGMNSVTVFLKDLNAVYGPAEGWENYGGIIRDVYIEFVNPIYISDYIWNSVLTPDFASASCRVNVEITDQSEKISGCKVVTKLLKNGITVCTSSSDICLQNGKNNKELLFDIEFPQLWSPDSPALYELVLEIISGGNVVDSKKEYVGLKDFKIKGTKFYLNGKSIFLKGVCRHDMWGKDQGFTLIYDQMEQDLQMIKHMGANFVRLVHYPHNKKVIEIADRIGLLVSEEPGLWWSNMENRAVTDAALEVMGRTVIRDRNNPSVAFWLAFNECIFTDEYLDEIVGLCRKLDPTRPVSGANCMNLEMTKNLFSKHGVDFYTFHPYGYSPDHVTAGYGAKEDSTSIKAVLKFLNDKPVVFTEWGGWFVHDNPALFTQFCDIMLGFAKNCAPEPNLTGMIYWVWADMFETNRGLPACSDGMLIEGLVDVDRNIRINYHTMTKMFSRLDYTETFWPKVEIYGVTDGFWDYKCIDFSSLLKSENQDKAWDCCIARAENTRGFFHKKKRCITYGPTIPEDIYRLGELPVCLKVGKPLIISTDSGRVCIDISGKAENAYFIGHVTFAEGYPVSGKLGDMVARYTIIYEDRTEQEIPLRNGIELTTVLGLYGPSRIDPRASIANRVIKITYDPNWEIYYINIHKVNFSQEKAIKYIEVEVLCKEYSLLLYGITLRI